VLYSTIVGESTTISVTRVGGTAGTSTVEFSLIDSGLLAIKCEYNDAGGYNCTIHPATSGSSSAKPSQLRFIDGQTLHDITITVVDDDWNISKLMSATLQLKASNVSALAQAILHISPSQAAGFAAFTVSTSDVQENDSYAVIDLVRVNGSAGLLSVQVETFDITALGGYDYASVQAPVVFGARQTNISVMIKLIDDAVFSGTRSFGIRIVNQSISRVDVLMTRTIVVKDDEDVSSAVPNIPLGFEVVRATGGEIELECVASEDNSTVLLGFLVRVAAVANKDFVSYYNMTDSTFILSGLSPHMSLWIAVAAWNSFGSSQFSPDTNVETKEASVPSLPRMLQVVKMGGTSASLQWDVPRDNGGSIITGYDLELATSGDYGFSVRTWSVSGLATNVSGLNVATSYTVYIAARSVAYPVSNIIVSNTTMVITTSNGTVPSQPPQVKLLDVTQSGGSLSFGFSAPEDSGGWPVQSYALYLRENVIASSTTNQTALPGFREACSVTCDAAKVPDSCVCTVYKLLVSRNYEVYAVARNEMVRAFTHSPAQRAIVPNI
jgi:hypothetical protein